MEIVGYQSKVNITQVLPCVGDDRVRSHEIELKRLINTSWLYDPFGDNLTYGVEFRVGRCFSWEFFLFSDTSEIAEELGGALMYNLQDRYKGLDGEVNVYPLYSEFLNIDRNLYELVFPSNPPNKLNLLRKIINYYKTPKRRMDAHFFILWKRDNLHVSPDPFNFMLRTFVTFNPNSEFPMNSDEQASKINTVLRYFISDVSIPPYQKANYILLPPKYWKNIITSNVFPEKAPYGELPRELMPKFINPRLIDFDIPLDLPLLKPPVLENRNTVNLGVSKDDPNYIYIGKKMNEGVLSTELALIKIDELTTLLNIFGKIGTGKSTLIKIALDEIQKKRPEIGILILNFGKPFLEDDYPMAHVYKFPSEQFKVPYITLFDRTMISIRASSNTFAACLGLKYLGPQIFSETLQQCYSSYNKFPADITEFFRCVDENLKAKSWEPEYKQHVCTAFKRRIYELFHRDDLKVTLNLIEGDWKVIPDWFTKWKNGETVLLDLTKFVEEEQHLIGMLIFNMIENLIPIDTERSNKLKYLLIIDEAHRIAGKASDTHSESPEFIMKNSTNSSLKRIWQESRAKCLGIINADQNPHLLHEVAIDSARKNILFQLGYPSNQIFGGTIKERDMLLTLQGRYALVINNNERYLMRTRDDLIP